MSDDSLFWLSLLLSAAFAIGETRRASSTLRPRESSVLRSADAFLLLALVALGLRLGGLSPLVWLLVFFGIGSFMGGVTRKRRLRRGAIK